MTKRRSLSKRERLALYDLQQGICACGCGYPLGDDYIAEHGRPVGLGNVDKPDHLRRKFCAYLKTVNEDMPRMNKADRQGGRKGQQARRAAGKTKKIQSPGFRGWRRLDGTPVWKGRT